MACLTVTSTEPEPSSGNVRPANCASRILLISVNGRSIGTPMLTPPGGRRDDRDLVGKRAVGLGLFGGDAGLGLDADGHRDRRRIDARLHRDRAGRPQLEPERRQRSKSRRCLAAGSSGRPWPIAPARSARSVGSLRIRADTASICSPTVLSITGLTCAGTLTRAPATERLVSPRLTCAGEIGLEVPGRGEFRPRGDGDAALDFGVGVELLDIDAADLLGGLVAEQAAERVADRAGRLRRQRARDVQRCRSAASPATARPGRRSR